MSNVSVFILCLDLNLIDVDNNVLIINGKQITICRVSETWSGTMRMPIQIAFNPTQSYI